MTARRIAPENTAGDSGNTVKIRAVEGQNFDFSLYSSYLSLVVEIYFIWSGRTSIIKKVLNANYCLTILDICVIFKEERRIFPDFSGTWMVR